jgi:DNA-directed RNA polymerase subunit M/transcription elongation factor TFIIS
MVIKVIDPQLFRANIANKIDEHILHAKKSKNIEISAFNFTVQQCNQRKIVKKWDSALFVSIYMAKIKSILVNLSPDIIHQIQTNQLRAQSVAFLTHQELRPEIWTAAMEKKCKQDSQKFEVNIEATTDTFTCHKCGSNKCSHYCLQTRSADEAMTIFVTCLSCNKKWKC